MPALDLDQGWVLRSQKSIKHGPYLRITQAINCNADSQIRSPHQPRRIKIISKKVIFEEHLDQNTRRQSSYQAEVTCSKPRQHKCLIWKNERSSPVAKKLKSRCKRYAIGIGDIDSVQNSVSSYETGLKMLILLLFYDSILLNRVTEKFQGWWSTKIPV